MVLQRLILAVVLATIFSGASHSRDLPPARPSDYVTDWSDATWEQKTSDHPSWVVVFYSHRCGYCETFAGHYNNFAASLANVPTKVARVNVETEISLSLRFFISQVPTVFLIQGQDVYTIDATRKSLEEFSGKLLNGTTPLDESRLIPSWRGPFGWLATGLGAMGRMASWVVLLDTRLQSIMPTWMSKVVLFSLFMAFMAVVAVVVPYGVSREAMPLTKNERLLRAEAMAGVEKAAIDSSGSITDRKAPGLREREGYAGGAMQ